MRLRVQWRTSTSVARVDQIADNELLNAVSVPALSEGARRASAGLSDISPQHRVELDPAIVALIRSLARQAAREDHSAKGEVKP